MYIKIPVSPSELIDKMTILEIKLEEIADEAKLKNIQQEFNLLDTVLKNEVLSSTELDELRKQLRNINKKIWDSENYVRQYWNDDARFVEGARQSHYNNDERARLKREINTLLGSSITEEKSHPKYEHKA